MRFGRCGPSGETHVNEPPPTHQENTALLRAKALLGSAVRLERRSIRTQAGGKTGLLVYGYRIVRGGGSEGDLEVLGIAPPEGSSLDLSRLGSPEEALQDALRRRRDGAGAAPPEDSVPAPEPVSSELSTSSLDLPVA